MPDVGYLHLSTLAPAIRTATEWADGVADARLRDIAQAFKRIAEGLRVTIHMPPTLAASAMMIERARILATLQVLGKPLADTVTDKARGQEVMRVCAQILAEMTAAGHQPTWEESVKFLEFTALSAHSRTAVHALCANVIVGAWTAFESVAADLWERAVNLHPVPLADRTIRGQPRQSGGAPANRGDKTINLSKLSEAQYDLRNQMGTLLLKRWRKVDFNSLRGIRSAYDVAFDRAADAVFEDVPAHRILHVVEAVRNVYAHRGGVADDRFLRLVRQFPAFKDLQEGDVVALDGAVTANLTGSAISAAAGLLKFVDDWIGKTEGRPERPPAGAGK